MAICAVCNSNVIIGGVRDGGHFFCNATCRQGAPVLRFLDSVPESEISRRMEEINQSPCPVCQQAGPLDYHEAHTVWSALLITSWKTNVRLSCSKCARHESLAAAATSFLLGWWGFPWGLIVTPIQVSRNVTAAIKAKPSRPTSTRMVQRVRIGIAREMMAGKTSRPATPPPLPGQPTG